MASDETALTCLACRKISVAHGYYPAGNYTCPNCGGRLVPSREAGLGSRDARPGAETPPEVEQARRMTDRKLGRFVLVDILGSGAMGRVWRAWDDVLRRWVALKMLVFQDVSMEDIQRFRREAKVAASLDHPNIAPVYDLGETAGKHWIVMKLLEGESLDRYQARQPGKVLPVEEALRYMRDVCTGVGYAHNRGIIHRDLKPANFMIEPSGRVVVMDFGLAKGVGLPGITEAGQRLVMGTPAFMSPEAARGMVAEVDARSDVFALGASLFQMILGRPIFPAPTGAEQVMRAAKEQAPRARSVRADIPPAVDDLIAAATASAKAQRPRSATELGRLVEAALATTTVRPSAVGLGAVAGVLLVEDDPVMAALVAGACEQMRLHLTLARDVGGAKEALAKSKFRLILVDEFLPDGRGVELVRWMRSQDGAVQEPILVITGHDSGDVAERALEAGASDFMLKPFTVGEFRARAARLLR